jgi:hypothetical protein
VEAIYDDVVGDVFDTFSDEVFDDASRMIPCVVAWNLLEE